MSKSQEGNKAAKGLKWRLAQYVERRWWRNYLKDKNDDRYLTWKKEYWASFFQKVQQHIQLKEGQSVADMGCGPAGIFTFFENQKVLAVDPLLDMYTKDLSVFDQKKYPWVSFQKSTIEDFSTEELFHLVCCLNVINHVNDIQKATDKLFSLTKPGGYCLLSIDAHNHGGLKTLFRLIPGDILHPYQYDLEEYKALMTNAGFQLIDCILIKKSPIFNYFLLLGQRL